MENIRVRVEWQLAKAAGEIMQYFRERIEEGGGKMEFPIMCHIGVDGWGVLLRHLYIDDQGQLCVNGKYVNIPGYCDKVVSEMPRNHIFEMYYMFEPDERK